MQLIFILHIRNFPLIRCIDFDNKLRTTSVTDNQYIKLRYFSISERDIHIYQ